MWMAATAKAITARPVVERSTDLHAYLVAVGDGGERAESSGQPQDTLEPPVQSDRDRDDDQADDDASGLEIHAQDLLVGLLRGGLDVAGRAFIGLAAGCAFRSRRRRNARRGSARSRAACEGHGRRREGGCAVFLGLSRRGALRGGAYAGSVSGTGRRARREGTVVLDAVVVTTAPCSVAWFSPRVPITKRDRTDNQCCSEEYVGRSQCCAVCVPFASRSSLADRKPSARLEGQATTGRLGFQAVLRNRLTATPAQTSSTTPNGHALLTNP